MVMALAVGLGWLCVTTVLIADGAGPKPICEVERAAVGLATQYLSAGPDSWWPSLSQGSPLRALGRKAVKREIAVRCGPPKGATWRLRTSAPGWEDVVVFTIEYPSGLDETLSLELVQEDGWKIVQVRISAEPLRRRAGIDEVLLPVQDAGIGLSPPASRWAVPLILLLAVATYLRLGQRLRRVPLSGLLLVTLGGLAWSCAKEEVVKESTEPFGRLAPLLTLREITAAGGVDPEPLFATLPSAGLEAEVGHVWEAAYRILRFELNEAQTILDTFPSPSGNAAVEVLRARLGFLRSEEVETLLSYERARDVGPDHDGLRLEMAQSYLQLGYIDKSEITFELLRTMGSREPDVHYFLAQFAVFDGREEAGTEHFKTAWSLQPVERDSVFSDPFLAYLATRPEVFPLLELASVVEPLADRPAVESRPLSLPEDAEARLSGDLLELTLGESTVIVPGGGSLAQEGTAVEDAGAPPAVVEKKSGLWSGCQRWSRRLEHREPWRSHSCVARPRSRHWRCCETANGRS